MFRWTWALILLGFALAAEGCVVGTGPSGSSAYHSTIDIVPDWVSPAVGVHQGYATDGQSHFLIDSTAIYRRADDTAWTVIASDTKVLTGTPFNHFGDGDYWDGKLWIAVERTDPGPTFSMPSIMQVDPNSLKPLRTFDLTGIMPEISGLAISPSEHILYATSWTDSTHIWRFNLPDVTPASVIQLTSEIPKIQGITLDQGNFDISMESGDLFLVRPDGRVVAHMEERTAGSHEGLKIINGNLWWLVDPGNGLAKMMEFRNIAQNWP